MAIQFETTEKTLFDPGKYTHPFSFFEKVDVDGFLCGVLNIELAPMEDYAPTSGVLIQPKISHVSTPTSHNDWYNFGAPLVGPTTQPILGECDPPPDPGATYIDLRTAAFFAAFPAGTLLLCHRSDGTLREIVELTFVQTGVELERLTILRALVGDPFYGPDQVLSQAWQRSIVIPNLAGVKQFGLAIHNQGAAGNNQYISAKLSLAKLVSA